MIEVRGLSKRYGGGQGIHDISLTIAKGAVTSFIGPNGAGKSTLLSLISRLIPMDEGQVQIAGADVSKADSRGLARVISILKQSNQLNVKLKVGELVEFGRFPHSSGRLSAEDHRSVDEAIRYMELEELRGKFIDQLSGGQRQRAFIAMVLAQDTDYILLDEPLNNLDLKHSVQMMKVLRRLTDELGKTIVLVLHDINFAAAYSDSIVALKEGRVIRHGSVDDMMDPVVLKEIYDIDIPVHNVDGRKVCLYFR
ncbi:iron complex transport system ATP-binding protein [Paenibacillus catalpae]|uniref:Iron complex transport system ATP-binding protein n=1 Tax=Paenibacillus catalpae TaxID=1045775 RepID=A0A1I2DHM4_9BACL|nr:ATP-binding cassette domain-containing protein [Paenibacillus catalpae]SFE79851.1 iron complex transport system ATP-binding protein [Paenibacillus catalpae]